MPHHWFSIAFGDHDGRKATLAVLTAAGFTYCPRLAAFVPPQHLSVDKQHHLVLATINALAERVPAVHRHHPPPATGEPDCTHPPLTAHASTHHTDSSDRPARRGRLHQAVVRLLHRRRPAPPSATTHRAPALDPVRRKGAPHS